MGGRQVSRKSTREEFHVVTHTLLGLLQIVRCRQIDEKLTPGCRKILNLCLSHVAFLSQSVYAFQNVLQILLISSKFAYKFWGSKCDYFLWSSAEIANCFWSTSQELLRGVSMLPIHSAKKKKYSITIWENKPAWRLWCHKKVIDSSFTGFISTTNNLCGHWHHKHSCWYSGTSRSHI